MEHIINTTRKFQSVPPAAGIFAERSPCKTVLVGDHATYGQHDRQKDHVDDEHAQGLLVLPERPVP